MKEYRSCTSTWIIIGGITCFMGVMPILLSTMNEHPQDILGYCSGVAILTFGFLWLKSFRLTFTDSFVGYRSLFAGSREIEYQNIESIDMNPNTSPIESPYTISIKDNAGKELRVNLKVFSFEATRRIRELNKAIAS